jgi:hypothetical protein
MVSASAARWARLFSAARIAVRTSAPDTHASMRAKPAARSSAPATNHTSAVGGSDMPRPTRYTGTMTAPAMAEPNPLQNTRVLP